MAVIDVDAWVPEQHGGAVVSKIEATSVVERVARVEPMSTATKSVPRSGGVSFSGATAKGVAYSTDSTANDEVLLTARKFGKIIPIAEEDIQDTAGTVSVIETKKVDWARAYAVGFDNACLGTSAAANGTTVPYLSLYQALNTTNSDVGYTADDNVLATAGALEFADLSAVFELVEDSNFWNDPDMVVIAHPKFRAAIRGITGTDTYYDGAADATASDGRPVFVDAPRGSGVAPTLFDVPILWSLGARVHATATDSPTGNPLLFVGNRQFLIKGDRSGAESMISREASWATDEVQLKTRIRRGFAVGNENAWAVLELSA